MKKYSYLKTININYDSRWWGEVQNSKPPLEHVLSASYTSKQSLLICFLRLFRFFFFFSSLSSLNESSGSLNRSYNDISDQENGIYVVVRWVSKYRYIIRYYCSRRCRDGWRGKRKRLVDRCDIVVHSRFYSSSVTSARDGDVLILSFSFSSPYRSRPLNAKESRGNDSSIISYPGNGRILVSKIK